MPSYAAVQGVLSNLGWLGLLGWFRFLAYSRLSMLACGPQRPGQPQQLGTQVCSRLRALHSALITISITLIIIIIIIITICFGA